MDQLVQISGHLSPHGIHQHVHLLLYHLHVLSHARCADFHFRGIANIFWFVPFAGDVAFFLVFLLLLVSRWQLTPILLTDILIAVLAILASLVSFGLAVAPFPSYAG